MTRAKAGEQEAFSTDIVKHGKVGLYDTNKEII